MAVQKDRHKSNRFAISKTLKHAKWNYFALQSVDLHQNRAYAIDCTSLSILLALGLYIMYRNIVVVDVET